ncbi:MAG: PaaI family thioesterase [Rhodobacteraceae bacterium]|nr:PaaI family thioesterase [Paracoccaceae bacterium]
MNMIEFGRDILNRQSFSRLLGAELLAFEPGRAELRLSLRDDLKQQHGFAHGGLIAYLADNALTFAGGSALGGEAVVSQEMKINYIRPGIGAALIARAETLSTGTSQAVVRCDVFALADDGSEKLCAAAQGTIVRLAKG